MNKTKNSAIYDFLRNAIIAGDYLPGHRFPREIDFAKKLNVGKVTLRTALARLEHDGLIERLPSKGTFVRLPDERQKQRIMAILPQMDDITSPHLYILPGIQSECARLDIELVPVQQDFLNHQAFDPAKMKEQGYIGIILLPFVYQDNDPLFELVRKSTLPSVIAHCVRCRYEGCESAVLTTFPEAWTDAAKYLAGLGHRRFATLVTDTDKNKIRYLDAAFFRQFLIDTDAGESVPLIRHIDYYDNSRLRQTLDEVLVQRPTAILCHSDFIALKVYDFLREKHLRIPQDIAVMGYCGFPGSALLKPPLSTVDLNYAKRGQLAVQLITDASKWFGRQQPPFIELSHTLTLRESTNKILLQS